MSRKILNQSIKKLNLIEIGGSDDDLNESN